MGLARRHKVEHLERHLAAGQILRAVHDCCRTLSQRFQNPIPPQL